MRSILLILFLSFLSSHANVEEIDSEASLVNTIDTQTLISKLSGQLKEVKKENEQFKQILISLKNKVKDNEDHQRVHEEDEYAKLKEQLFILFTQRSCYDWKKLSFEKSGSYLIDPDGKGIGEEPIRVECNLFTGHTIITHDLPEEQNVTACSGLSCFTQTITYSSATKGQIEALIKLSDSCQQYLGFKCKETPLRDDNGTLTWWEDRHGNKQTYFLGNDPAQTACTCGLTKSCVNPKKLCSCDSEILDHWLQDYGYINSAKSLPISKLHFGTRVGMNPLQMKYKVGALQCYGRKSVSYPETCQDVWLSDSYASGYYRIGKPGNTRVVYCDMAKIFNKNYTPTPAITPTPKPVVTPPVVFYACLTTPQSKPGRIIFKKVNANIGNGYNPANGVFTVPYNGLYEFHIHADGRLHSYINLKRNGKNVAFARGHSSLWSNFGISTMIRLKQGDRMTVYLTVGHVYSPAKQGDRTVFSGKLIREQ